MEIVTRKEAQEQGLNRYYTGKPCKHGHLDERFVNCKHCVACNRQSTNSSHARRYKDPEYRKKWAIRVAAGTKARLASSPKHRVMARLRTRLYQAVVLRKRTVQQLLGCSPDQVRAHLEAQFQPGMAWDNYGEWHIDHIRPCASFDLTDPEQQRLCFHWSNLQPLWAKENLKKGATYGGPA
jgi:hypothetical protein